MGIVLGGGTFTAIEIALTIVIAAASVVALVMPFRLPWSKPGLGLLAFLVVAALRSALIVISLQSPIAHDAELLRALR